jgi:broad specificity phosphatase PhoE
MVFLVRHGVTEWHREGKVLGQRDIPLSAEGVEQSRAIAQSLSSMKIADVISSPLVRAVRTAELIGDHFGIQVARDPRFIDFRVGKWEGMKYEDISASPEYQRFLADPMSERIPGGGEHMQDIRKRAVGGLEQSLEDSPSGAGIVIVTHAGIIRVLLSYYVGSNPANYHRIRVNPGSVSVLSFSDDKQLPRILAMNWLGSLEDVLQ